MRQVDELAVELDVSVVKRSAIAETERRANGRGSIAAEHVTGACNAYAATCVNKNVLCARK